MSASPGALGGLRGLAQLRQVLSNIQVLVLPGQVTVPLAQNLFKKNGYLEDEKKQEETIELGARLTHVLRKLDS